MSDTKSSKRAPKKTAAKRSDALLAVSTVIFSLHPAPSSLPELWIPLVRRTREPHLGDWALPGGWVCEDESLEAAAARTLVETTSLRPSYLEQLYTFGDPNRSSEGRVISVVYNALVRSDQAQATQESENVRWHRADSLPRLAFDHNQIVEYALWRLRNKIEYAHVAFFFLGETFTLSQLREVYEAILQRRLDPANFRRQIEASGTIVATDQMAKGGAHRPARLYRTTLDGQGES